MDNEWNYNEELEPGPEHIIDPEFTPEYPDVSFFKESYVTMREENIFQGEVPQGESAKTARETQKEKRSRYSWVRKILGSAMRGGAAIVAAAALIGNAAETRSFSAGERDFRNVTQVLHKKAFDQPDDYTPDELGALWQSDPEAPHNYDYNNLIVLKEPTCTENGYSCYVCTDCGVRLTHVTTKPHEPGAPVQENIVEPDCVHDGSREDVTYCKVCGKELSRTKTVLGAPGHTPGDLVIENVVDPTCVLEGSEDDVIYCTVCGEEISRTSVVLEALGHENGEPVIENVVEASCLEDGSEEEVIYCAVCGEEVSRTTVVLEATGHTEDEPVIENEVAAKCTASGSYDEVVYCAACGEELSRTSVVTEALGHNYTAKVTAATCTAQGYTTHTCSRCGSSYKDTYTAALGHSYTAKTTAPTCTAQGYTTHTCSRCGTSYKDNYKDKVAHKYTLEGWNTSAPPLKCNVCGAYAFTVSIQSGNSISYTISKDLINQAYNEGNYVFEWGDISVCLNNYYGQDGAEVLAFPDTHELSYSYPVKKDMTGVLHFDFTPTSGTKYYYSIRLRIAASGSSDYVNLVFPKGGQHRTYTQP